MEYMVILEGSKVYVAYEADPIIIPKIAYKSVLGYIDQNLVKCDEMLIIKVKDYQLEEEKKRIESGLKKLIEILFK